MNTSTTIRFVCFTILLLATQFLAAAQSGFTDAEADAIQAFLRANFGNTNAGMVIGLVDERGSRVLAAGKLDNGTRQEVNGDTVFEIGSVTKTFTTLFLQDMVERDEVKLDDPVAKYLPKSVKVPARDGKQITLLNLATHTAGLPRDPSNLTPGHGLPENAFADYTVEKLYAFLSSFTLDREPGSNWDFQVYDGAGGLRSTANDLLKYVSAQAGITQSRLTPIAAKTHVIRHRNSPGTVGDMHGNTAMAWYDQEVYQPPAMELLGHGGGTGGYSAFIGFDKKQRRGVAVLSNHTTSHSSEVGWAVLQRLPLTKESGTELVREIVGLGFMFDLDQKTHTLLITKVYPKSSAGQAGLSSGLNIQKINDVPTAGKSTAECFSLLRANDSPKVRLELVNQERKETNTVELTRGKFLTSG